MVIDYFEERTRYLAATSDDAREISDGELYERERMATGGAVKASRNCYWCTRLDDVCYQHDDGGDDGQWNDPSGAALVPAGRHEGRRA